MKAATLAIGGRLLGEGQPCLVVAHVETFHEGRPDMALRLIEAAFQAGADEALLRAGLEAGGAGVALVLRPLGSPAAPEELRLADLAARRERHGVPVGLFDTTDGASAFALVAPALAAAHGAALVEKRLLLDRSRKSRDAAAALAPEEFYRMVELLRQAERARGDGFAAEPAGVVREAARGRSIVAASLIGRGDVLTAERLLYKRTDARQPRGLAPAEAHRVIGRRARRPIQADETIKEDMLE
jgi:sialic acid synthase SpsE